MYSNYTNEDQAAKGSLDVQAIIGIVAGLRTSIIYHIIWRSRHDHSLLSKSFICVGYTRNALGCVLPTG